MSDFNLRPHHLLCILTYIGKGYSEAFTENFSDIIKGINEGARTIQIIAGPDDICAPRLKNNEPDCHCHEDRITKRDALALTDLKAIISEEIDYGSTVTLATDFIKELQDSFSKGTIRSACKNCQWYELCTKVAQSNYRESYLEA